MRDALAVGIIILFLLYTVDVISDMNSAKDLKLKYSIEEPSFMGVFYYTNSYKIDSVGCVSFYNELDSNSVILCGSYKIQILN